MKELLEQIKRFQDLKYVTGTTKSSSYEVNFYFHPWNDTVNVEFGGYDCGDWSGYLNYDSLTEYK